MIGKIYLAGPEVFLPNMPSIFAAKIKLCADYKFGVTLPSEADREKLSTLPPSEKSAFIYAINIKSMHEADFGIFNLTPFRGPSADVGTVFELGFMAGLGKPVFGYTNVPSDYLERITPRQETIPQPNSPPSLYNFNDANGWGIEDHGNADNLMIDETLNRSVAPLVRHTAPLPERLEDLTAFKACLEQAATKLG